MHTSFADQLAGLDLAGFSIGPAPVSTSDFPVREAVVQTLEADWSDLLAMMSGTAVEADAEELGWAFVNRSEEHTSELQSLMRNSYAVSCLKKKNHSSTG